MGFKTDREFLRNVSIGALGTRKVAAILNRGGFQIIELERCCTSNKIWATKIKRLRVPDLLCLRTGIRIESRAKSKLEVTMSHSVNNPDRAWDMGLRDDDLVAFIQRDSDRVALFRASELRETANFAGLSRMKSAAEGSEIRLTWPATVPACAGVVTAVTNDSIVTRLKGRTQTYRLTRKSFSLSPHVNVGDTFGDGDTIIASILRRIVPPVAPQGQYDFLRDLNGDSETVYCAVKALGHLGQGVDQLTHLMHAHEDSRVRLEAAASLARMQVDDGWSYLTRIIRDPRDDPPHLAHRMEVALILAELLDDRGLLQEIAIGPNPSELRAVCIWGMSDLSDLLPLVADEDEAVAVHAIVTVGRLITPSNIAQVIGMIGPDYRLSAGIVRALLGSQCDSVSETVLQMPASGSKRQWLLYLLASQGREKCHAIPPALATALEFFWSHHAENWTNRLDVADQIDFLGQQDS